VSNVLGPGSATTSARTTNISVNNAKAVATQSPSQLNDKVESSRLIDNEEFYRMLDGVGLDDIGPFKQKLQESESFDNFHSTPRWPGRQNPVRTATTETEDHSVPGSIHCTPRPGR
jgi:hypothetical protein